MEVIIDVHTHTFNAMDIPLKGYLLSRKYKGILKHLAPLLIPGIAACIRGKVDSANKKNLFHRIFGPVALEFVCRIFGKEYKNWSKTLSKNIADLTSEMIETFEKDNIGLYVPLMIDFEYWFKSTLDNPIKNQIDTIYQDIIIPYKGKIHPFVAFDPARELAFRKGMTNPDGEPEEDGSMKLVRDAIENKGFIGVKLYNAMGYRPINNNIVDEKRKKIPLHKKKYKFNGEEYDKVLTELYDYCIEFGVPITTHCGMDGSEPYKDASFDFGHAIFWRDVLGQQKYQNLHLNLAHFGWNKQDGHIGNRSWVREICEMVSKFDHLYTDVSHHEVILDEKKSLFTTAYQQLLNDFPEIKNKILFGIDWHVIKRVANFENFKKRYIEILKSDNLFSDQAIEDFLGRNALKFLGLLPGEKNRARLEKFYHKHSITPPEWFETTAEVMKI